MSWLQIKKEKRKKKKEKLGKGEKRVNNWQK